MLNPAVANFITQFYPLGNTPAVNLARCLPQGLDADILLLGCGDIRNILFTAYSDQNFPSRRLDFTCCDTQEAIIARNALLFSLLIDDEFDGNSNVAWSIYYDLYLDDATAKLLQVHIKKLLSVSSSLDDWRRSKYGSMLSFCDETTFYLVKSVWTGYSTASSSKSAFGKELQRSKDVMAATLGKSDGRILTGMRSAAPLSRASTEEISKPFQHFWKHGSLSKSVGDVANPLFSCTLSPNTRLHYATDPLLGYHLATAFASLAPGSPLRPDSAKHDSVFVAVAAAMTQFSQWTSAFRSSTNRPLKIRFVVADALTFCHVLQHDDGTASSANLYRRQFDASVCDVDEREYTSPESAPRTFDVIDTSNLADHFGPLNFLVATTPLLKDAASSTIYLENLIQRDKTRQGEFDQLLCGHAPTVSLLLGVSAVEEWTNATSVNYVDEMLLTQATSSAQQTQCHSRISWKLNHHLRGQNESRNLVRVESEALTKAIFQIYLQMFEHENHIALHSLPPEQAKQKMKNSTFPAFHRGSLVALMKRTKTVVDSDWTMASKKLIASIRQNQTLMFGGNYIQELCLQLHIHGLYSDAWITDEIRRSPSLGGFHAWKTIPPTMAVTLVVPRKRVYDLFGSDATKVTPPTLHCLLESSAGVWLNYFADLHIVFGKVKTSGHPDQDGFSVVVEQDAGGWNGTSPLVASFYAPAVGLQAGSPKTIKVGLGIVPTMQSTAMHSSKLGPRLVLHETTLSDTSQVFVTKHLPGTSGHPVIGGNGKRTTPNAANHSISANIDESGRATTLTGHVDIQSDKGKKLLTDRVPVELRQTSPFIIDIVFGKEDLVYSLTFPLPVSNEASKTRIARKSCYIEVVVRLADLLKSEFLSDFIYPCVRGVDGTPLTVNSDHVDLEVLPILDVDSSKKENEWLNTLASHQFSVRERRLREAGESVAPGITANRRLNFKESLLTIFMLASGIQGGHTGLFAFQHADLGVTMLLFVRAIRIDGAAGSVVADAAIIPLHMDLITSGKVETFLLLLRELQACSYRVDDTELRLWKRMLPALAESCRTWTHGPDCEYKQKDATIPLSLDPKEKCLCSCGNGKLPEGFMTLPEWDKASQHAVRIALPLTFAVPFVEDIIDTDALKQAEEGLRGMTMSSSHGSQGVVEKCRNCNKTTGKLMPCSRCREVKYCSRECQKKDWKKHRMECLEAPDVD